MQSDEAWGPEVRSCWSFNLYVVESIELHVSSQSGNAWYSLSSCSKSDSCFGPFTFQLEIKQLLLRSLCLLTDLCSTFNAEITDCCFICSSWGSNTFWLCSSLLNKTVSHKWSLSWMWLNEHLILNDSQEMATPLTRNVRLQRQFTIYW